MSILNFAPVNKFYDKIQQGIKLGTIRKKPKRVGETLHLWEGKRGMRKGWYCPACLLNYGEAATWNIIMGMVEVCGCYKTKGAEDTIAVHFPRKIAEKKCTAVFSARMQVRGEILVLIFDRRPPDFTRMEIIDARDTTIHPLANKEGFNSNREMVECFRKYLTDGWETLYWIRWDL